MFERASAPKRIVFHRFSRKGQRALRPGSARMQCAAAG